MMYTESKRRDYNTIEFIKMIEFEVLLCTRHISHISILCVCFLYLEKQ